MLPFTILYMNLYLVVPNGSNIISLGSFLKDKGMLTQISSRNFCNCHIKLHSEVLNGYYATEICVNIPLKI